ncbi:ATP-dependent nuclease [Pontibacter indicus]|uniref:ATPase/GTPase, AAA15 family n=1 Tax=Pontibacter indicus TaxID=1317125 RepID=A0A1R3WKC7_9BACT|nr:AAA family ATPase [Pontibacter indicus]SIT78355.1 ATPase/GTPase, AAA15 family [Pontibacter indicus]
MIKELQLKNFKKFKDKTITLLPSGVSVLAGGNNSGKSSILHALAIWEFCKNYLINQKGNGSIYYGFKGAGIGISIDDFTPINIPALNYLWTNLKPKASYSLSIKCVWDNPSKADCFLEIGLALTQDRLFIKQLSSNLVANDYVPVIAYIPPFAGITDKEQWYSPADRRKLIGRGLAGSVLRNTIIEMNNDLLKLKEEKKGNKKKLGKRDYEYIRATSPLEILNKVLAETFQSQIIPQNFDPAFHNYVRVDSVKGNYVNEKFTPHKSYNKRDIMVEGSGFLQWLSVYTFALNDSVDILLLDEPDAHLHCTLQTLLLDKLVEISQSNNKQVLMASHSTEIIKFISVKKLLEVNQKTVRYLTNENQKIALIAGLGSSYSPKINQLQTHKNLLFVENESDIDFLKSWASILGLSWPKNLVAWAVANKHSQRKHLFTHLAQEISGIESISLSDRDNDLYSTTSTNLIDNNLPNLSLNGSTLRYRKWRRWEIENYLICVPAIVRTANCSEQDVNTLLQTKFSITFPSTTYLQSDQVTSNKVLFELEGKEIIECIENEFKINKHEIAKSMASTEIPEDIKTLINEVISMCS